MRLSEDRVNHLAHLVSYAVEDADDIKLHQDQNKIRLFVKSIMLRELELEDEISDLITSRMKQRGQYLQGSNEWHIEFQKEFEAEMRKRRGMAAEG